MSKDDVDELKKFIKVQIEPVFDRIDNLELRLGRRIDAIDINLSNKLEGLSAQMFNGFAGIGDIITDHNERIDRHIARTDKRLGRLEKTRS